jgi:AAA15 family ATPase/GTPase
MFIKSFSLLNYKSYIDSEFLEFCPGINIIIGQNNSGKTALLEALTLRLISAPHRSIRTLPNRFSKANEKSAALVKLSLQKSELRELLQQVRAPLRLPEPGDAEWTGTEEANGLISDFQAWLNDPESLEESLEMNLHLSSDSQAEVEQGRITESLLLGFYPPFTLPRINENKEYSYIEFFQDKNDHIYIDLTHVYDQSSNMLDYGEKVNYSLIKGSYKLAIGYQIFDLFRNRIYRFHAERLNVSTCTLTGSADLKPDASNLAEVLNLLPNKNPLKFLLLNTYISNIFPHIKHIFSINKEDSQVEIRLWTPEAAYEDREDLTFPLSNCGTGISQVLAILYVVITSQLPRTIIIDEPQSFLHPGAAKKLIEILKEFPQHQYFIATHSPMLITAAHPARIIKLSYDGCETKASVISPDETTEQRSILAEVGVRLSDVFGADDILWVEGPTEEQCFPLILEKVARRILRGTAILSVKNTGDLEGKNANLIFDIYDKLSGGSSLFPPAIGFVLDREGKTKQQMEDLKRRSSNSIEFLPRRMYENYLLVPEAITAVVNRNDSPEQALLTEQEVQAWIEQKKQAGDYIKKIKGASSESLSETEWLEKVDASKLLKDLFAELSEARVQFSKPKHSYELTAWIVEHQPEHLSDLAKFLEARLGSAC